LLNAAAQRNATPQGEQRRREKRARTVFGLQRAIEIVVARGGLSQRRLLRLQRLVRALEQRKRLLELRRSQPGEHMHAVGGGRRTLCSISAFFCLSTAISSLFCCVSERARFMACSTAASTARTLSTARRIAILSRRTSNGIGGAVGQVIDSPRRLLGVLLAPRLRAGRETDYEWA
jgi:hypothetical protein